MEELASAFTSSLGFDGKIAPVTSCSQSHSPLYKAKGSGLSSQDERRRRNLELQKERRKDYIAQVRRIVESDEENEGEENEEEEMESSSSDSRKRRDWYKKHMANQLMLSEWMVDVPPDLEENWLMMLCPKGRRCLVTTNKGTTRAFRKSGHCFKRFPSLLPAGRRRQTGDSKPVVLDCIYSEAEKTFYVLDVMCWMNHPVYDSDSEFRFFWLQAKFSEVPDASWISNINPYAFFPLPCYPCSKATMESVMGRTLPFKVELDGILFYHKQTHYTPGSTPLVGWLKPWMLPGVLHVSVPQRYIDTKPPEEPWTPPAVASEMECTVEEKKGREPKEENAG